MSLGISELVCWCELQATWPIAVFILWMIPLIPLGQTANVKVWISVHAASCDCTSGFLGFLSIQHIRQFFLLGHRHSLIIVNYNASMACQFGNSVFIHILIIQKHRSYCMQGMIGVFTRQTSWMSQLGHNFCQCLNTNWLTTVPDVWVVGMNSCQRSQIQVIRILQIL